MATYMHTSVMVPEVLALLQPRPGGVYCDVTLGGGGHAEAILHASSPTGRVLGMDRDPQALDAAQVRLQPFGTRLTLQQGSFDQLMQRMQEAQFPLLDGLVADLGVSSAQLDQPHRGFSFRAAGPIDMRMDPTQGASALQWIERATEEELANVIYTYGEERFSRRIARDLKSALAAGALTDTVALAQVVERAVRSHDPGQHPATRTFQALRIAVNDELRQLDNLLTNSEACLRPGGRLVILSFHSLEDRLVKQHFKTGATRGTWRVLTPQPVVASETERRHNPRSRSARIRAAAYLMGEQP